MAYLGNSPARSFISFERQVFTIVNSQTAYTLDHSVTNENDIRLVVNNIVQEPGSGKAYTASGTTLTLSAALTNGTDEMYCVFLGRAVGTVNAPAGSVGTSQIADDAVTLAKMASGTDGNIISYDASGNPVAVATGTAGQILTSAGAGAPPTFATPSAGGITMAEQWRLSAILTCSTTNTDVDVTANLEKVDTDSPGTIGSSMTESSGVFSFPSTGVYLILNNYMFYNGSSSSTYNGLLTRVTTDNSSYSYATENYVGVNSNYNNGSSAFIFDVTNTSTHKVKFTYFVQSSVTLRGSTDNNMTSFSFIRLGDT